MRCAIIKYLVLVLSYCVVWYPLHCQSNARSAPLEVTVCKLVTKCSQYDQKRVRFKAEFISDGLENSSLVDTKKCSQGIQPWTSKAVDRHSDIKTLNAALAKGYRGTRDKQIVATFTGRYECGSKAATNNPRILRIESIKNLTVTPRNTDSPGRNHAQL
jgi:hypothetical protein